ncbi:unnamed protein product, partial [Amoebophrya sp. A25]
AILPQRTRPQEALHEDKELHEDQDKVTKPVVVLEEKHDDHDPLVRVELLSSTATKRMYEERQHETLSQLSEFLQAVRGRPTAAAYFPPANLR